MNFFFNGKILDLSKFGKITDMNVLSSSSVIKSKRELQPATERMPSRRKVIL